MSIDRRILKAARVALDLSQDDVAQAARISRRAIQRLETGEVSTRPETAAAVESALLARGIVFIRDANGVGFYISRDLLAAIRT